MKKALQIYFLIITTSIFSQKITIRGIALDTTKNRNRVTIVLNDTLNKLVLDSTYDIESFNKTIKNKNFVVHSNSKGKFKIKARKSDTLSFYSYKHISKKIAVIDLIKKKPLKILLEPEVCEIYVPCVDSFPSYYVFIGKKIKLNYAEEKYCNFISLDSKFNAEYEVIENIYGKLPNKTAKFVVYDHNSRPEFGKFDTVMLFIGKYCNELFHLKYQFYPLYKTEDGKLASPYQTFDYSRLDSTSAIKPELIKFKETIEIDIKNISKKYLEQWYPKPYYKIENEKAIAIYGNYIPELLELKKQTILKERKIILK